MTGDLIYMLLLAVLQGLTEFLPVSSSGHLVIGEALLGIGSAGEGVLFETAVHIGTLFAVLAFYRKRIAQLAGSLLRFAGAGFRTDDSNAEDVTYTGMIIAGTVPAAVAGIALRGPIISSFGSPALASACLVATGLFLLLTIGRRGGGRVTWRAALLIGLAQAVAILPGCSRSGWTITTAILCGIGFSAAAEFSFLLSVPAIAGAFILEASSAGGSLTAGHAAALALSTAVAAVTGYAALKLLVWLLGRGSFHRFSWYLIPVGTAVFIWYALSG